MHFKKISQVLVIVAMLGSASYIGKSTDISLEKGKVVECEVSFSAGSASCLNKIIENAENYIEAANISITENDVQAVTLSSPEAVDFSCNDMDADVDECKTIIFRSEQKTVQSQEEIHLYVKTTAYYNDYVTTNGSTSTGVNTTKDRTIAVDPNIIPYGTTVYIDGSSYTAEDTGSAIVGNKIDIYMDTYDECMNYGVQYKDVYYYIPTEKTISVEVKYTYGFYGNLISREEL